MRMRKRIRDKKDSWWASLLKAWREEQLPFITPAIKWQKLNQMNKPGRGELGNESFV